MPASRIAPWSRGVLAAVLLCACAPGTARLRAETPQRADDLAQLFREPPASARPWVFWYWLQGAVSREGLTADLAAMKQAGIGGAYLMPVTAPASPPVYTPVAAPLTPEWWELVRHAATEADRLGLKLGLAVSDGFATAGGPWITPELSMQKVVWSESVVEGGKPITGPLPQPPTKENFYRDIALFAYPAPPDETAAPVITTSLPGFDAQFLAAPDGVKQLRCDGPGWIQYAYAGPFTPRSLMISQWDHNYGGVYHATRLIIEASDDGVAWRPVTRLVPPRHGWQDWGADYTFAVPETTARYFRFVHDATGAEAGSEDLNGAKWKPRLVLRGLRLSAVPRVPGFEGKSGAIWRRSARATTELLPDALCVPRDHLIDLSARLGANGRLNWTPPPGRWVLLRLGHTSTGQRNETATAAPGLECDKLNPAAVRLQFDRWFGEAVRQLGPELASRVLKVLHVDSWEAGSQNWSPVFREEFKRRRGYEPGPLLATLAGVPIGSAAETEQFLADVRRTIADLTTENFFGTLAELAHAHGCEFSAESTAPTMMTDHLRHYGLVDLPMGEFWLRSPQHDKPNDMHDAISGAHIYGKNIVQAEAFTELRQQWDEHPGMLKAPGDRNLALGMNRFVLHVSAHNPWPDRRPGLTLGTVGVQFNRDQTWWSDAKAWVDYLARCSALLQHGRPVVDVAYFTGEELPLRALLPGRRSPALPEGYAADSINADALVRLASFKDGRLVLPGGASYAALVLPAGTVSRELGEKLRELQPVIVRPGESLDAARLPAPDLLALNPDGLPAPDIEWTHRSAPDAEIYFISNQQAVTRTVDVSLRTTGLRPEIWQPVTGEMNVAAKFAEANGRTTVPLPLDPNGSVFVVLRPLRGGLPDSSLVGTDLGPPSREWPKAHQGGPLQEQVRTLDGPWQVAFDPAFGGPAAPVDFPTLTDWSQHATPGIRFYSGTVVYSRSFDWDAADGRVWLNLGQVHNLARVTLNGIDCGVAWTPPFQVEITSALRPGKNQLDIRVTNTWSNRLTGDREVPPEAKPATWTTGPQPQSTHLLPSGLLGSVRILSVR